MEQILQCGLGSKMFSLLDEFSGYNKILDAHPVKTKTIFHTKLGTYVYRKILFGLINDGATFQRTIDISLYGLINTYFVVYLDDVTIFLKRRSDHLTNLRHIFNRYLKYIISFNPKKNFFVVTEGKLLWYFISMDGIVIGPKRTQAITSIVYPNTKKEMQSFLGRIKFVCRFITRFVEIVKPLQNIIKKYATYKWTKEGNEDFYGIKEAIAECPNLKISYFEKELILYTFTSNTSYVAILTQKNDERDEVRVYFMSSNLQGTELKYLDIEKHGFAVFKEVKHFIRYLLKARTKIIIPHPALRSLFIQNEMGER